MFVEKSEKAKGKKKMEYVDVSSKDGSEEEDGEASSDEVGHLKAIGGKLNQTHLTT